MVVVSEPGKELVGGGQNAKYVVECKELYMADRGIEKLRGFEPFVNLESLWLNGNKLKKINNLDKNFRIKALYVQDNQICTLRGSLLYFTFLDTVDLSNNQLRDLDKQLKVLEKCKFLRNLNLTGNPLVEEPDYRLTMIHHMPQLHVLDQHVVTEAERRKAAALIGGNMQALTVAFGQRVPPYDPAWDQKVPDRSVLEQELIKEAEKIRDIKAATAYEAEIALFKHNPYPDIPRGNTLPPNAGTRQAKLGSGDQGMRRGGLAKLGGGGFKPPPLLFNTFQEDNQDGIGDKRQYSVFANTISTVKSITAPSVCASEHPLFRQSRRAPELISPHVPKDVFRVSSCTPGHSELQASGTRLMSMYHSGPVRFEQEKYESFVKLRACGREKWGLTYREALI